VTVFARTAANFTLDVYSALGGGRDNPLGSGSVSFQVFARQ
jgi:hypothetical protein